MKSVALTLCLLLASVATAWCNPVTLAVGPQGVDYSAQTYSATCQTSYLTSSWVVISIDGQVCLDANVPAGSCSLNPTPGQHTIQCVGKHWTSKNPHVTDGTVTQTITALAVTPTPIATPPVPPPPGNPGNGGPSVSGCYNVSGRTWYVSSGQVLPPAQAGDAVLFKAGDVFNVEWDDPPSGICISSYGTGQAIFDGQNKLKYAIDSISTTTAPPKSDHITIDNLEIRHYTQGAIVFANNDGFASSQLQQITISNNLLYDNGPGCSDQTGPCVGNDIGGYLNIVELMDSRIPTQTHAWHIVNNTVKWCGGHNCLQVHFDAGPTQVIGNTVGPGCVHGCLDVKGSGSVLGHANISNNTVTCGLSQNLCGNPTQSAAFYTENPYNAAGEYQDYSNNTASDSPVGFQACAGGCVAGKITNCPMTLNFDSNTVTNTPTWALYLGNGMCDGQSPSTAQATLTNNSWGTGTVHNGF